MFFLSVCKSSKFIKWIKTAIIQYVDKNIDFGGVIGSNLWNDCLPDYPHIIARGSMCQFFTILKFTLWKMGPHGPINFAACCKRRIDMSLQPDNLDNEYWIKIFKNETVVGHHIPRGSSRYCNCALNSGAKWELMYVAEECWNSLEVP